MPWKLIANPVLAKQVQTKKQKTNNKLTNKTRKTLKLGLSCMEFTQNCKIAFYGPVFIFSFNT